MFKFKIWNQANDNHTMAIRLINIQELYRLGSTCTGPDAQGRWHNLQHYLTSSRVSATILPPFDRIVDIHWNRRGLGVPPGTIMTQRNFHVTYTGPLRVRGGFATQGYIILDPAWTTALLPHKMKQVLVDYSSSSTDVLTVY